MDDNNNIKRRNILPPIDPSSTTFLSISALMDFRAYFPFSHFCNSFSRFFISTASAFEAALSNFSCYSIKKIKLSKYCLYRIYEENARKYIQLTYNMWFCARLTSLSCFFSSIKRILSSFVILFGFIVSCTFFLSFTVSISLALSSESLYAYIDLH